MKYIALLYNKSDIHDRWYIKSKNETLEEFKSRISKCFGDTYSFEICEYKTI